MLHAAHDGQHPSFSTEMSGSFSEAPLVPHMLQADCVCSTTHRIVHQSCTYYEVEHYLIDTAVLKAS